MSLGHLLLELSCQCGSRARSQGEATERGLEEMEPILSLMAAGLWWPAALPSQPTAAHMGKGKESQPPELRQPVGPCKVTGTCAWGCFSHHLLPASFYPSACLCSIWGLGLLVQKTHCNQHHGDLEALSEWWAKRHEVTLVWRNFFLKPSLTTPTDSLQSNLGLILILPSCAFSCAGTCSNPSEGNFLQPDFLYHVFSKHRSLLWFPHPHCL